MQNGVHPRFAKLATLPESSFTDGSKWQVPKMRLPEVTTELEQRNDKLKQNMLETDTETGYTEKLNHSKVTKMVHSSCDDNSCDLRLDTGDMQLCTPYSRTRREFNYEIVFSRTNCDNFSDRSISIDRFGKRHARRSNRNTDGTHKASWSRNNISATMERFEPTQYNQPSSSASSLDYGLVASVVTSVTDTPHLPQRKILHGAASYEIESFRESGSTNHAYSYAYYEPGAVKVHTDIPQNNAPMMNSETMSSIAMEKSRNKPQNVIPVLHSKAFRCKPSSGLSASSSTRVEDRHTYTTRYGTTENLYEEVNEQKIRKVLSDNRISISPTNYVKEELRRVQNNHFRVLEELNLSLEALIMPSSPRHLSLNTKSKDTVVNVASSDVMGTLSTSSEVIPSSVTLPKKQRWFGLLGGDSSNLFPSRQPDRVLNTSLENLSATFHSMELKDQSNNSANNPEFDEGDFDSGFSGSGSSSGASYNESVRDYKPTSSGLFISKTTTASLKDLKINNGNRYVKEMSPGISDNKVTTVVCSDKPLTAMPSLITETLGESTRDLKKVFKL